MAKLIRNTYPKEISIGLLLLVFAVSAFLSHQIFEVHPDSLNAGKNTYIGAFMVASAVVIMMLVLWEEFLFPIHVKLDVPEVIFSNHRSKLKKQATIYLLIPILFVVIYNMYAVNIIRFLVWAAICTVLPVVGKLISGIKNYNDFLKMTDDTIEYKNNEKEGIYEHKNVQQILLIKDDRKVLHKIQLIMANGEKVLIDIDEMELEAYYAFIDEYLKQHYGDVAKEATAPLS